MRRILATVAAVALLSTACNSTARPPLVIGAIYPLSGTQGPGGLDEYRGVALAVDMVNRSGGVSGRSVQLQPLDVADQDAVPGAMDALSDAGTPTTRNAARDRWTNFLFMLAR